jgi:putative acetyltransferase
LEIRPYLPMDCGELTLLFYQTIHSVNRRDYSAEQCRAWAPAPPGIDAWNRSLLAHYTLVAEEDGTILGFGDITHDGYLDRLYVHKDHQGCGVATALCNQLEDHCHGMRITTHASITAKHFFERRGYHVQQEQHVLRSGCFLTNFIMEKPANEEQPAIRRRP